MPIVKIPNSGGKQKVVCDNYREGCSQPDILPKDGKCRRGHDAKEYGEKEKRELEGFNILSQNDISGAGKDPDKLPRTPQKIYDDIIKEHS